jgi:hypothetical protein
MFLGFASIVGGTILFSACGVFQYTAFAAVIDASPGYNFTQTAKTPQADIVFVQATVTDAR